ncbi:MAG: hypothetical protein KatS3mg131_3488 [Candidatus Tectimicrobiota bacterium]|nr:MAG: hypothetical protein KatS3mg131_3488 [Candidatus Tectomicrobia bacterium]
MPTRPGKRFGLASKPLAALEERLTLWLARVGAVALAGMMGLTFADVVGRFFFNRPIVGTVEVTELLMGLLIYGGLGYTTVTRGHIRVDLVITRLSPRRQALLDVLTLGLGVTFSLLISWQLWRKALDTAALGDLTQLWRLPVWPVAYAMAACSLTLPLGLLLQWLRALRALGTQKPS